jgi:hypothetical protein
VFLLSRNLQRDTTGNDVREMQRRLNELGYLGLDGKPLAIDGRFGANTLHAVNTFKNANLPGGNTGTNEGVVSQTVWRALFSATAIAYTLSAGAAAGAMAGAAGMAKQDIMAKKAAVEQTVPTLFMKQLFLTENNCYISGASLTPKGIMVHSTAANNPNLSRYVGPDDGFLGVNSNNNHWNQPKPDGLSKCVHAFIGKLIDGSIATYQTLPWSMRGWHGGGSVNNTHIGFEICEDALNPNDRDYFDKVYWEAVWFCVYLCKMFAFDPLHDGVLICIVRDMRGVLHPIVQM